MVGASRIRAPRRRPDAVIANRPGPEVDGLVCHRSRLAVADTTERLRAAVEQRGMTVFAEIDHGAAAAAAGLALLPMRLLIFGNAKGGTPLMQVAASAGIDLPLRALVWEDPQGATWLAYNDPHWLAERHGIQGRLEPQLAAMAGLLSTVAAAATDPAGA